MGFLPRPLPIADRIFYYGVAPVFTFAIPPLVILDWPRDRTRIYQSVLVVSVWMWSMYQVVFMCVSFSSCMSICFVRAELCDCCRYLCGNYNPARAKFGCNGKDFLTLF